MATHDEKYHLILKTTWKLMEEFGYRGTTMDRICRRTGMARGNFYNYFDTKEAVFFAIMESACQGMEQLAASLAGQGISQVRQTLGDYLEAVAGYRQDFRLYNKLALEAAMEHNPVVIRGLAMFEQTCVTSIASLLDRCAAGGLLTCRDSRLAAFILYETYTALAWRRETHQPPLDAGQIRQALEAVLCDGLVQPAGEPARSLV